MRRSTDSTAASAGGANWTLWRRAFWALARLKAGRPLKASLVAREFEVSERTALRDFDFLRDQLRVPLEFDRRRQTFFVTEPMALLTPITISRGEMVALFFAERVLRQYRGTPFQEDLESALRKIQELMPESVLVSPEVVDAALSLDLGPTYSTDPAVFAEVLSALNAKRVAVVRYRSANSGKTRDRRIHPYHVFNYRGDWYVAAFDESRAEVRDFALHRIGQVVSATDTFEIARTFNARRYLDEAFGIEKGKRPIGVAIRFSPRQARWIRERKWHRTARVEEQLDGGCVLRFRAAGLGEVKRWVMQFGAAAEVLEPAGLRRQVAAEVEAMRAAYGGQRSATKSERPRRR